MSIDYQQILMDMNRPGRRQGRSYKKLLAIFLVLTLLGGGGYAVWHFGLIGSAWSHSSDLYAKAAGWVGFGGNAETVDTTSVASVSPETQTSSGAAQAGSALRSPASPVSVPAPDGSIDVASQSNSRPISAVVPVQAPPASPVRPVATAQVAAPGAQTSPGSAAGGSMRPAAVQSTAGPDGAPTPILSDAKARIRVIDSILVSDPSEAMRRIEDLIQGPALDPDDAAEAGYRMGYAARMLHDEDKAEKSWQETAEKWPGLRGGRFAALALADTWYHRYAGDRAQVSFWDDIQTLYSRVLGEDDAPFLPDNVKDKVKANLNRINDSILFGSAPTRLARYHKVESGELLGSIANRYRVDYESIARINGINPNRIRQGMDLKLVVGEVSIVVRKNERDPNRGPTVTWFLDGRWAREYAACVGDGDKTPAGIYNLTSKERDPSWTNPVNGQLLPNEHPENILGSRWMAMRGMNTSGLGIHGTTVDDSIPGYTSAGCIRLLNRDVEELFSYARIGTKVTVLD